jgi:tetratricopeptide (TPR) repeat protein
LPNFGYSPLGWNKVNLGSYEEAHDLYQMALELLAEAGEQQMIGMSYLGLGEVALVRQAYAEARQLLEESVAIYRQIGQRDEEGLALAELGCAVRALGHLSQVRQYLCEALLVANETGALATALFSVAHTALLLADQGEPERAVELYALASRYPYVGHSRYWEDLAGRHIAAVAATLPPEVVAAAEARGRARDLAATVTELLAELRETWRLPG